MPFFEYKAIDNHRGNRFKARLEANSLEEAFHLVDKKGRTLVSLNEKGKKKQKKGEFSLLSFLNKVTPKDLVMFSRQFAVMLRSTVPVVQSLRILVKQTKNPKLKTVLTQVANEVDSGHKLSESLAKHPKAFSEFFVAMIKSGETSGRLDEILEYLADQQEKDYDLTSKIKGAMIYPAFIIVGLVVVGAVMMIVVVPKLTDILKETGGELPVATKILMATSGFMVNYWYIVIIAVVVLIVGFRMLIKTKIGKTYWHWSQIKFPIFGRLFQKIYLVRFTRSLSTLSSGGIPMVDALTITSQVVGNQVYRNIIDRTIKEVEEGNTIGSVFIKSKHIPSMVSYMISVGEQTGRLDVVLEKLSDFYTREIDNMVANLVSLIEPLIMVVLGVSVGIMVAAIIMPMYNLASSF